MDDPVGHQNIRNDNFGPADFFDEGSPATGTVALSVDRGTVDGRKGTAAPKVASNGPEALRAQNVVGQDRRELVLAFRGREAGQRFRVQFIER